MQQSAGRQTEYGVLMSIFFVGSLSLCCSKNNNVTLHVLQVCCKACNFAFGNFWLQSEAAVVLLPGLKSVYRHTTKASLCWTGAYSHFPNCPSTVRQGHMHLQIQGMPTRCACRSSSRVSQKGTHVNEQHSMQRMQIALVGMLNKHYCRLNMKAQMPCLILAATAFLWSVSAPPFRVPLLPLPAGPAEDPLDGWTSDLGLKQ